MMLHRSVKQEATKYAQIFYVFLAYSYNSVIIKHMLHNSVIKHVFYYALCYFQNKRREGNIMPPKSKYTKEEVVKVAYEMTRELGVDAVTTREIGKRIGASPTPIFTLFRNMQEVKEEVRILAWKQYEQYISDALNYTPVFKQFGIRMIEFAKKEPKLFQLLYMQEREESRTFEEMTKEIGSSVDTCIEIIKRDYDLEENEARILFSQVWLFTFSLCVLLANKVCTFSEQEISRMLTVEFQAELRLIKSGQYKELNLSVTEIPKGE